MKMFLDYHALVYKRTVFFVVFVFFFCLSQAQVPEIYKDKKFVHFCRIYTEYENNKEIIGYSANINIGEESLIQGTENCSNQETCLHRKFWYLIKDWASDDYNLPWKVFLYRNINWEWSQISYEIKSPLLFFNNAPYTSSSPFLWINIITCPLLKIVDDGTRMVCEQDPVIFNIQTISSKTMDVLGVSSDSNIPNFYGAVIQVALANSDPDSEEWIDLSYNDIVPGQLTVKLNTIPASWMGKELKIRIKQVMETIVDNVNWSSGLISFYPTEIADQIEHSDMPDYYSEPVSGIYVLPKPNLKIDSIPPKCNGESGSFKISNFPTRSDNVKLKVNVIKLSTKKPADVYEPIGDAYFHPSDPTRPLYWYDQTTNEFIISSDSTSYTITDDDLEDMELKEGFYLIQAFWLDKSGSQLCAVQSEVVHMTQPAPVEIKSFEVEEYGDASYNIGVNGGSAVIKGFTVVGNVNVGTSTLYKANGDEVILDKTSFTAGNYKFYALDSNGCQSTDFSYQFKEPSAITFTAENITPYKPDCHESNTTVDSSKKYGKIIIPIVTGGIPNYSYVLKNTEGEVIESRKFEANIEKEIESIKPGKYFLELWDQGGIFFNDTLAYDLTAPKLMSLKVGNMTESCNYVGNGSVELQVINGIKDYTFFKGETELSDSVALDLKGNTNYSFKVEDANGCIAEVNDVYIKDSPLIIESFKRVNPVCDESNGSVEFSVSGGKSDDYPYHISLKDIGGGNTINIGETYTDSDNWNPNYLHKYLLSYYDTIYLEVYSGYSSDTNYNCVVSKKVDFTWHNPLNGGLVTKQNASCSAVDDGEVILQINGLGSSKISGISGDYSFTQNESAVTILDLYADSYDFTLTDERGCEVSFENINVEVTPDSLNLESSSQELSCPMVEDGILSVKGINGRNASGYQYQLEKKVNEAYEIEEEFSDYISDTIAKIFDHKGVGDYILRVRDSVGCVVKKELTLGSKDNPITWNGISSIDASCDSASNGCIIIKEGLTHQNSQPLSYFLNEEKYTGAADDFGDFYCGLFPGDYEVRIEDQSGCYVKDSIEIDSKGYFPELGISTLSPVACEGKFNGSIQIAVVDAVLGKPAYKLQLGNEDLNVDITEIKDELAPVFSIQNLTNSPYEVTVKDGNNCFSTTYYTPELAPALKLTEKWNKAPCAETNGIIDFSAEGGIRLDGYNFYFDSTLIATGVDSGSVEKAVDVTGQLKVVDAEGCELLGESGQFVQVRNNPIGISDLSKMNPSCIDVIDGEISFVLKGLSELAYSYELFLAADNQLKKNGDISVGEVLVSGLGEGIYYLYVYEGDDGICNTDYMGIELTFPDTIKVSGFHYNKIQYYNQATGRMDITIEGGNKKYEYELKNLSNGDSITDFIIEGAHAFGNLRAGNYLFRFRDINGCFNAEGKEWTSYSFVIEQPESALEIIEDSIRHISCFAETDGYINVSGTGGWGSDYAYSLVGPDSIESNWQLKGEFKNLSAGNYTVLVRDTAGAEAQWNIKLEQPAPFDMAIQSTSDATCPLYANGKLSVISTNGVYGDDGLNYTITRSNDGVEVTTASSDSQWEYRHLSKGTYAVVVTDANGCFVDRRFVIGEPDTVKIAIDKNYIKVKHDNTGEVAIQAINGNGYFEYEWHSVDDTTLLNSGFTTGDIAFNGLTAGDYLLMLKDTAGCFYEGDSPWLKRTVTLEEPLSELGFQVAESPVSCKGLSDGQFELIGTGGWGDYEFSFEGGTFTTDTVIKNLAAGNSLIAVRDSAGVIYQQLVEMTEPDTLEIMDSTELNHVHCFGGSDGRIIASIIGGNPEYYVSVDNVQWAMGNVVDGLSVGTYRLFVKDAKGCEASAGSFVITQPAQIVIGGDSIVQKSTCLNNEGSITASFEGGTGALNYTWFKDTITIGGQIERIKLPEFNTPSIANLYSGRYILNVTDDNGCEMPFNFFVGDISDLSINSITTRSVSCYGYSDGAAWANVTAGNPPYRYVWDGEGIVSAADSAWHFKAGEFGFFVTDDKGCSDYRQFEIGTPDSLYYRIEDIEPPLCSGGSLGAISVLGIGGTAPYQYSWDNGLTGFNVDGFGPGSYRLTLTDSHNCESVFSFEFEYLRNVKPFIGNDTIICHYNTLTLDGGDYSTYSWHSSENLIASSRILEVNQAATYYLTVTDEDNCIGLDTLTLDVSELEITGLSTQDVTCAGLSNGLATVTIASNSDDYTIFWPDGSHDVTTSGYSGGDYNLTVSNPLGCSRLKNFSILEPAPLTITTSYRPPLCPGVPDGYISPVVKGGSGNYRYQWEAGSTQRERKELPEGDYTFTVTDDNDCRLTENYHLPYIRTLQPLLGDDRVVCKDNTAFLNPGHFSAYNWFLDGESLAQDSILEVEQPGDYVVIVNDEGHCVGSDTVKVDVSVSDLEPSFLMATSVPMNDTLLIVEVTQPKPSGIVWDIEGSHKVVEEGEYFTKVVFEEQGLFSVMLSAYLTEGCQGQARKSVLVTAPVNGEEDTETVFYGNNLISLVVSPNPSSGQFNAQLELREPADVTFYLVRIDTGQIYETRKRSGLSDYNEKFVHAGVGQFVLFAESGGERLMVKLLVY